MSKITPQHIMCQNQLEDNKSSAAKTGLLMKEAQNENHRN